MVLREAPYPNERVLSVTIDIEALRHYRTRTNRDIPIFVCEPVSGEGG